MSWPSLLLRMPAERGSDMLDLREVNVPSRASLRLLAAFSAQISEPAVLAELAPAAGKGCRRWGPGREWRDAGWEGRGSKPRQEWLDASLRSAQGKWARNEAIEPSQGEWEHGGWVWCPSRGCWMAQVFVVSGGAALRSEGVRLQPAALTIWQWDHDLFDEHRQSELTGSDLVGMCQSMTADGLADMISSLKGAFEAPGAAAAQLRSMAERRDIEASCLAGSDVQSVRL